MKTFNITLAVLFSIGLLTAVLPSSKKKPTIDTSILEVKKPIIDLTMIDKKKMKIPTQS